MARCSRCGRSISGFSFGRKLCPWCQQAESAARGEDVETQRVEPVPWRQPSTDTRLVTQIIFGLNAAVFVGMMLAGAGLMGPSSQMAVDWGANFGPLTLSGEWWRKRARSPPPVLPTECSGATESRWPPGNRILKLKASAAPRLKSGHPPRPWGA